MDTSYQVTLVFLICAGVYLLNMRWLLSPPRPEDHPITGDALQSLGFTLETTYDRDFSSDKFHTLRLDTFRLPVVHQLGIEVTICYVPQGKHSEPIWKHHSTVVEIQTGNGFYETGCNSLISLHGLIRGLGGSEHYNEIIQKAKDNVIESL